MGRAIMSLFASLQLLSIIFIRLFNMLRICWRKVDLLSYLWTHKFNLDVIRIFRYHFAYVRNFKVPLAILYGSRKFITSFSSTFGREAKLFRRKKQRVFFSSIQFICSRTRSSQLSRLADIFKMVRSCPKMKIYILSPRIRNDRKRYIARILSTSWKMVPLLFTSCSERNIYLAARITSNASVDLSVYTDTRL